MNFVYFNPDQKFVVIANDVSFYSTAFDIINGVGEFSEFNNAIRYAMEALADMKRQRPVIRGICSSYKNINVQIDIR